MQFTNYVWILVLDVGIFIMKHIIHEDFNVTQENYQLFRKS